MAPSQVDDTRFAPVDVLVVGGGMAGIAAALGAARMGASTILVERGGWLGGIGVTGATGLHSFFNIHGAHPGVERVRVVGGVAQDLVDRVQDLGGGIGHVPVERGADYVSTFTPVDPEVFRVAAATLLQEAGVHLLLHTVADEVRAAEGHVNGVVVWHKGGRSLLRAKQVIDCSGDGDVAAYAGAPCEHYQADYPGETYQEYKARNHGAYQTGFTFRLCNIDLDVLVDDLERHDAIRFLAHAVKPGTSTPDVVRLGFRLGPYDIRSPIGGMTATSIRPRELTHCNCINFGPINGLDAWHLTEAEVSLRRKMLDVVAMFRERLSGCQGAYAAGAAPIVGQRRSRAIHCDYEMTLDDCLQAARFDDAIGCFSFIDDPRFLVRDGGYYQIPYRALIVRDMDNLLVAGRMMTVDRWAHTSTRNTVCCLLCGHAAGTAAALAARTGSGPRDVDVRVLQDTLVSSGAILEGRLDPL